MDVKPEAAAYQLADLPTTMQQEARVPAITATGVPAPTPQHGQEPDQEPMPEACTYQEAGNKTRDILKWFYKTTCNAMHLSPDLANCQMRRAGTYAKVQVKPLNGPTVDSTAYSEIFQLRTRYGVLIKRLIFFGKGGLGKSTMFDKIAFDWANETSEILDGFKLVILLKMSALSQASNLVDSAVDQLLGEKSGIENGELDKFILAHPNEVLILLDGFDAMKTDRLDEASYGSILKALQRTIYEECFICVSTRPSHVEVLTSLTLIRSPYKHIEVLGFTDEVVNSYIQSFYAEDLDSGKALIHTIRESNMLRYLTESPVLLVFVCLLWKEKGRLSKTTSCLFTEAVDNTFTRQHLSGEYASKVVLATGRVALRGLASDGQRFSFPEKELEPKVLKIALKAGILTRQRVIKNCKTHHLQFVHKTVQEHCAAKYMQTLNRSAPGFFTRMKNKFKYQRTLSRLCATFEGVVSNEFLFRLCCGDNGKCMTDIVNLLDRKFNKDEPRYKSPVIQAICRNCFLESQSAKTPQCLTSDSLIPATIEVRRDEFRSLIYLLEIVCRSASRSTQLAHVTAICASGASSVNDLTFALEDMNNLQSLTLSRSYVGLGGLGMLLPSLRGKPNLTNLGFQSTCATRASEWAHHIQALTSLTKLELACHAIGWDSMKYIAAAVASIPSLTDLSLARNQNLAGTYDLWTDELLKMKQLQRLDVSDSYLSKSDIEHIASTVVDMPHLTELVLACNHPWDRLTDSWATILPQMALITKLDLACSSLKPADVENIASAVADMPRLEELILDYNQELATLAESWSKALPQMAHLKRLGLARCRLTPSDVGHVASAVGDMPGLADLILNSNRALGSSAELWSKDLPRMRHLHRLGLSSCDLTPSDIGHVIVPRRQPRINWRGRVTVALPVTHGARGNSLALSNYS